MFGHQLRFGIATFILAVLFMAALAPVNGTFAADKTAKFELTLDVTWSAAVSPFEFPSSAHLSGVIGATHNARYVLFRDGETASSGLELVAENGRVAILRAELAEAKRRRRVGSEIDGDDVKTVPGKISTQFETTTAHPLASFVTMVAPSPDWFTGAADVNLMAGDDWIDEIEVPLWAWDAGTDSGATFIARDDDSQPQESIRLVTNTTFPAQGRDCRSGHSEDPADRALDRFRPQSDS